MWWTYVFISLMHISKSRWINRSNGNHVFNVFRNCLTSFHSGCTILYSHQQQMWVLISLHPHQHWLFSIFQVFFFFFWATAHGMWDLSSSTRDLTQAPCNGSAESEPLDHWWSLWFYFAFCFVIILDHPSRYEVESHCGFDLHIIGD